MIVNIFSWSIKIVVKSQTTNEKKIQPDSSYFDMNIRMNVSQFFQVMHIIPNQNTRVFQIFYSILLILLAGTTREHLGFALALGVPVFVVITKIDMCRRFMIERTVSQLEKILKSPGCNRVPLRIKSEDDAMTAAANFNSER